MPFVSFHIPGAKDSDDDKIIIGFYKKKKKKKTWALLQSAKSLQSYLTLCNPMDYSPPGSSAHGDSPSKNTEVGCPALLQEIFPNQ